MLEETFIWVMLALLLVVNAFCIFLVVMQLPGTWLLVVATAMMAIWQSERITWRTLVLLVILAILGEVVETVWSAKSSREAGGTRRGAILAIVLAVAGAIVGSFALPPIGTLIGACVGAGGGSYLGDLWAGRSHAKAVEAGRAAAKGRLWGTIGKVVITCVMWIVTAVAVFWQ